MFTFLSVTTSTASTFPEIDMSITITSVIAVTAIISPILTAIINNRYLLKMKKLELEQHHFEQTSLHKRQIFENYLKYAGQTSSFSSKISFPEYSNAYLSALMYVTPDLRKEMIEIHEILSSNYPFHATGRLEQLTPKLYDLL